MSLGGATIVFEAFMATAMAAADQAFLCYDPDGVAYTSAQTRAEGVMRIRVWRQLQVSPLPRTGRRFELPQASALLAARPRASRASSVDPKPLK